MWNRRATSGDVRDQPKVADAASELLQDVFGKDKTPCRLVYGVASLPLGTLSSWKSFSRWQVRRAGHGLTVLADAFNASNGGMYA